MIAKILLHLKTIILSNIMPLKTGILNIIIPLNIIRYEEVNDLLSIIKKLNQKQQTILDISSPYIAAYHLASQWHKVTKTDINSTENKDIKKSLNLHFEQEDATKLSYSDNSFDFVYSISVLKHIYMWYEKALREMVRVCKPWWYIYITVPISSKFQEERIAETIYSHQQKKSEKTFFQYRFDKDKIDTFMQWDWYKTIQSIIYREKRSWKYDECISFLKKDAWFMPLNIIKNAIITYYYWFTLLLKKREGGNHIPKEMREEKPFWNIHLVFQKNIWSK